MGNAKRRIALFPAHPAQVWILHRLEILLGNRYHFIWFLRDKDISIQLADELEIEYTVVSKARQGILGNALELFMNIFRLINYTLEFDIDLWISKYSAAHIVSRLLGRKSIFFVDDDFDIVPSLYRLSCPFADATILPAVTQSGPCKSRLERFDGVFELLYLHPDRFTPDSSIYGTLGIPHLQKFAIIRLASLTAHHDIGIKGVSPGLLRNVIQLCEKHDIRVFITSEKTLIDESEKYHLDIAPARIHHALYFAEFFLGDSQTMTSEAAILGTPAFRINSFVGRISYLELIEKYDLAYGFKSDEETQLLDKLAAVLNDNRRDIFEERRVKLISDCTGPASLFEDVIGGFLYV